MRKATRGALGLSLTLAALAWIPPAASAAHFPNGVPITIPDGYAPAYPYPSTITTPVLTGSISHVEVTIGDLSFPDGDDLGILLQAPDGQALPLLEGGPSTISNARLSFDDSGAYLPAGQSLGFAFGARQVFRPTDYYATDDYPAGGPTHLQYSNPGPDLGGTATLASTFNGVNPNGIWKLWVADFDTGPHTGAIAGGWSLDLQGVTPDNRFILGSPRLAGNGRSATIQATVPNPGVVNVEDSALAPIQLAAHKKKRKPLNRPRVASGTVGVGAGTTAIPIGLTQTALKLLARRGKLAVSARITYALRTRPSGTASRQTVSLTFRTPRHRKHKHR